MPFAESPRNNHSPHIAAAAESQLPKEAFLIYFRPSDFTETNN
jgi:hypothetical protein